MREKRVSDNFHIFYELNRLWENTTWLGVPSWKLPFDAWIIQELIWKVKPDLIIETGSGKGGSALFYASILNFISAKGFVVSFDIKPIVADQFIDVPPSLLHRMRFYTCDSSDPSVLKDLEFWLGYAKKVMVILDSWHTEEHVRKELEIFSPLVSVGSYLIVEDTHVDGHPVHWPHVDRGPMGAVEEFLKTNDNFEVDKECEKLVMTFNPGGYLRRFK